MQKQCAGHALGNPPPPPPRTIGEALLCHLWGPVSIHMHSSGSVGPCLTTCTWNTSIITSKLHTRHNAGGLLELAQDRVLCENRPQT